MAGKILVTPRGYARYGAEARKKLEARGYEMDINETGKPLPREVFVEKAKEAAGIIVGVDECDGDLLRQCKKLKAIVKFGVGLDNIDQKAAEECGILVGRCVGSNSNAVAELTVGLMLSASRHIVPSAMSVKAGGWDKLTGYELKGKAVGVIGFGHIGQIVASICHNGFGMNVLAYDAFPIKEEALSACGGKTASPEEIYHEADYITVHVPLLDSTRNMIGSSQFAMMKPTAVVINAARGGIVNEKDLYNALKNRQIYAAASDVFTSEPPTGDAWVKELVAMPNFLLTSHIASRSQEAEINTVNIATDVMADLLQKAGQ